jgi:hypothetical protein
METRHISVALLCIAGLSAWLTMSTTGDAGAGSERAGVPSATGHNKGHDSDPAPSLLLQAEDIGPPTLAGFVAVWSMRGAATAPSSADPLPLPLPMAETATQRAERQAAHARKVTSVSVRVLELLARQEPSHAADYLAQANTMLADPALMARQPSKQSDEAVERRRQLNASISAKIDQMMAAQRIAAAISNASAPDASLLRPGDRVAPRSGDIAGRR